jgi:membrane protease YdiL (CAAX protease family)
MDSLDTGKVGKRFVNTAVFSEIAGVVSGAFLALAVFSYLPLLWPAFGEYAAAFVAASFIYLPAWAVWRRGYLLDSIAVTWPAGRTWLSVALTLAIIFPLFAGGFYAYHALLYDRRPCVELTRLADWPEELRLGKSDDSPGLHVEARGEGLLVTNRSDHESEVKWSPLANSVRLSTGGAQEFAPTADGSALVAPGGWLHVVHPPGPANVTIISESTSQVQLPLQRTAELPYAAERSYSWLLLLVFVQFILIALPEELFFRGYLQTRLQQLIPHRWTIWGGDVGPAVILTSVVFALSHLVAIPSGDRLAVFFPSLLFGWLRDRTGSIAGAVVAHALSNVLMQVLLRWLC